VGFFSSTAGIVSTVAGAIIAFGGAWAVLHDWTPASLAVAVSKCTQNEIVYVVSNSGGKAAVLGDPRFDLSLAGGAEGSWRRLDLPDLEAAAAAPVVKPNESPAFTRQEYTYGMFTEAEAKTGQCRLRVTVPYTGSVKGKEGVCDCRYE
jgi:hypothetical protein